MAHTRGYVSLVLRRREEGAVRLSIVVCGSWLSLSLSLSFETKTEDEQSWLAVGWIKVSG